MLDKVLKDVKYLKYSSFLYMDQECNVSHRSIGEIRKVTHTCGIPNNWPVWVENGQLYKDATVMNNNDVFLELKPEWWKLPRCLNIYKVM